MNNFRLVDTTGWKNFPILSFFENVTGSGKILSSQIDDSGKIPVYSSSQFGGGLFGYTNIEPTFVISKEIPFYVIFGDHTKSIFFVNQSFNVLDNVKVLKPFLFDISILNFIITLWRKEIPNLGYSRHWSVASKATILLPQTNDGDIDFDEILKMMSIYTDQIKNKLEKIETDFPEKSLIDTNSWEEYQIGELFDIRPTKSYNLNNPVLMSDYGTTPVVVNSQYNNGYGGFTEKDSNERGNIITFSDTTTTETIFYQPHDFVGYAHIQGMYPIGEYENEWNKLSLLFFVSIFKAQANVLMYDFSNKFTREDVGKMLIKLPTLEGEPDWVFMENFIQDRLEESERVISDLLVK